MRDDIGLAYIYCSYKEREKQTVVNLIASIVQQLLLRRIGLLVSEVAPIYESLRITKVRPTFAEYVNLLDAALSQYSKVYVVVDALDECSEEAQTRRILLETLQKLPADLCLFVTSRDIPSIQQQLGTASRIDIKASDEDIEKYVEDRISHTERLAKYTAKDATLKDTIKKSISSKACGM